MSNDGLGASATPSGSRATHETPAGLHPSGFDPSRLAELIDKATDEDLTDNGRYFDESYRDLTQCGHGDTGEYWHSPDGKLVEFLWNNRHAILALARGEAA